VYQNNVVGKCIKIRNVVGKCIKIRNVVGKWIKRMLLVCISNLPSSRADCQEILGALSL
jgi:hypothetical protein